jgi:ATP-dependent exoDNAse (exonuclease V) beta subunit
VRPCPWEEPFTTWAIKKQAIYRFRGGEPRLFDAVREELQPYPAKRDVLDVNYRSQREIVSFNNTVFSQENLLKFLKENFLKDQAEDGICLASGAFKEVCGVFEGAAQKNARNDRDGFVRIEALEGASKEEREDQARARVIPLVKELMKRFRPGDIAILTRTNHEAGTVTEWLLTEGVQCQSDRTLNIRENPVVKDIISFLRFLDSPIDNIAFAAFILGDVFVAASGISRNELREFIFRAHLSSGGKRVANLYTLFREKYPDVWAGLAKEFFKKAGTIPVYEFITGIINKLKVLESFPGDQAYVMRLLEFCRKYEADYPSLTLFLEFFDRAREEEFFVYVKDADSVLVMTVHQAKGLEFGAVIIPFLKMDVKLGESGQEDGEVRTSRPCIVEHDDKGVSLVYYNKDHGRHSPELASLYGEHYKRAIVDELDIIYVSLTRAKDELYIFCPRKANKGANPVLGLFPSVPAEYGSISGLSRSDADEAERKEIPVTGQADWFSIIGEEFVRQTR